MHARTHACAQVRELLRKLTVDLVLATDMKQHFTHTALFNSKVPALIGTSDAAAAAAAQGEGSARPAGSSPVLKEPTAQGRLPVPKGPTAQGVKAAIVRR